MEQLIILGIFFIIWLVGRIAEAVKGGPPKKNVPPAPIQRKRVAPLPGQPAANPQADRLQNEIDRFLKNLGNEPQAKPEPQPVQAPPQPRRQQPPKARPVQKQNQRKPLAGAPGAKKNAAAPATSAAGGSSSSSVGAHVAEYLAPHRRVASEFGAEVSRDLDADLADRRPDAQRSGSVVARAEDIKVVGASAILQEIRHTFRNPHELRRALIINEILKRRTPGS